MKYVDLKFKPTSGRFIIVTYYIQSKVAIKDIAQTICELTSFGESGAHRVKIKKSIFNKFAPRVFEVNSRKRLVKIAYPVVLFEDNSITHFLSNIMGALLSVKNITKLRIVDLELPRRYINSFQGPFWGQEKLRELLGIHNRALTACTIKPQLGLTVAQTIKEAKALWHSGVDIIREDERIADVSYNKFYTRVRKILKAKESIEEETGQKKLYVFNVTGTPDKIFERADYIKKVGGHAVMVDVVATGIDNVQMLRKSNIGVLIYAHRAAYGLLTTDKKIGIDLNVFVQLIRLAGADFLDLGVLGTYGKLTKPYRRKLQTIFNDQIGISGCVHKLGKLSSMMPIISIPEDDTIRPVVAQYLDNDVTFMCE